MSSDVFGRYQLLQKLGKGGMGEVYLAYDGALDRKIALKFLSESLQNDPGARRRFVREARIAAAIDHPYICKIYEAGEWAGRAFIAMEFLEGNTLAERLRSGPIPWDQARSIALEISEALIKAHQKNIVHRDLKPSNVMLLSDGHIKVLDFGIALRIGTPEDATLSIGQMTPYGSVVGTPAYMSPEQLRHAHVDTRSDIFSFGVLCYQMLSGLHPFHRPSIAETMSAILHAIPLPVDRYTKDCPPEISQALSRMLEKELPNRCQSMREFWDALHGPGMRAALTVPAPHPGAHSVGVLPFVNMSGDPEQEYFSDGITEDIIAHLSKVSGLRVIARTSMMRYKNTQKELPVIGRELGVRNVLEGSVRTLKNRVRVSAALVDTETSSQLWAEVFDRDMADIFAIQTEVAHNIAISLSATLPTVLTSPAAPANLEVYQLYLKGRFLANKITPDALLKAIHFFQEALQLHPSDALCHAGLARCYVIGGHYDYMSPADAFPKAKASAATALEINDRLAEPHLALALALFNEWDWQGSDREFRRAIELDPNFVDARMYYTWLQCLLGRLEEALAEARHALELDPLSSFVGMVLGWTLTLMGRFDEAILHLNHILELDPDYGPARAQLGHTYVGKGMFDEAISHLESFTWRKTLLGIGYAITGREVQARALLDEMHRSGHIEFERPSEVAMIYLYVGERELAAEWLEKAFAARDYMLALHMAAVWAPCRTDVLVRDYLRRMGVPG
jgi:serine/threonine protein kinase/tetratricopeptide (TPR) repeat protein